jgi:hypothetical protein
MTAEIYFLAEFWWAAVNHSGFAGVLFHEAGRRFREEENMHRILVPLFVFVTGGWVAWVIFSSIRRYLLAKMQWSVQMRLVEKIDSSQTLLAYAETDSGWRFLEALRVEQGEPTMQFQRILSGVQSGIVLSSFGTGMLLLHGYGVAPEREFTIVGVLALALGIGFGIAALASYLLSRSFGLLHRSNG